MSARIVLAPSAVAAPAFSVMGVVGARIAPTT